MLTGSVQGYLPVEANGVGEARQDPVPKRLVTIDGNHCEVGEDAPQFTALREAAVNHADFAITAIAAAVASPDRSECPAYLFQSNPAAFAQRFTTSATDWSVSLVSASRG